MPELLIQCKACGKEIAKSAKICPHCGKRNKKPWWQTALIVFAVIIVLSVIGNMTGKDRTSPNATPVVAASASNSETKDTPSSVPARQSTGIWVMGNLTDEFGEKTGEKFITSRDLIRGTFSNPATKDSRLDVQLQYTERTGLVMQLFEYGQDFGSPATAIGMEKITVSIQDGNGERYSLPGSMSQSVLYFNDRETIKEILLAGGNIKFRITISMVGVISNYSFDITNASGFDTIYGQYTEI
jgi:hypothetical protein